MPQYLIISPHCDDAGFSLGGAISSGALGSPVIVNVFSRTSYTVAGRGNIAAVTARRKVEEVNALGGFAKSIKFLDLLDAFDDPDRSTRRRRDVADQVIDAACTIAKHPREWRILLPCGVGGHEDHQLVNTLADRLRTDYEVWCYEDLPYATSGRAWARVPPSDGVKTLPGDVKQKEMVIRRYSCQLTPLLSCSILRYYVYQGGEVLYRAGNS